MVKLTVVGVVLALGWIADGSWKGAVAWAGILAFLWLFWEFIHYDPSQQRAPQAQTFRDEVETPAIRGRRNPDPTRPTTDDFMGMTTDQIFDRKGN